MSREDLLVVSNGHGEDVIGAALTAGLRERLPDLRLAAFPLVGEGSAYAPADVVGPRRSLPAGGLTLHHPELLLADLKAGILSLTVRQVMFLRSRRPRAVLVVGDAYAQALAALVRAPRAVLQPLVSVLQERPVAAGRLNRYFMESIRPPERLLLSAADRVYARDEPTAQALRSRGVDKAVYLGNPIMDAVTASPLWERAEPRTDVVVTLLPGSRGYAATSVAVMIAAIERLAALAGSGTTVTALVAWTQPAVPIAPPGWAPSDGTRDRLRYAPVGRHRSRESAATGASTLAVWEKGGATVRWERGAFAAVLATADVVIGTAGTANEQAAGLGLPVVAFAVPPHYGTAFLENQERLLGGALRIVDGRPAAIAAAAYSALTPGPHRDAAARVGPARLGGPGGTAAVATDLVAWLADLGTARR